MFEKLEIWERGTEYTVIYIVFRSLTTGLHHVQQANFLHHGASLADIRETIATHLYYIADIFTHQLPDEMTPGFATVREAIEWHKATLRTA